MELSSQSLNYFIQNILNTIDNTSILGITKEENTRTFLLCFEFIHMGILRSLLEEKKRNSLVTIHVSVVTNNSNIEFLKECFT